MNYVRFSSFVSHQLSAGVKKTVKVKFAYFDMFQTTIHILSQKETALFKLFSVLQWFSWLWWWLKYLNMWFNSLLIQVYRPTRRKWPTCPERMEQSYIMAKKRNFKRIGMYHKLKETLPEVLLIDAVSCSNFFSSAANRLASSDFMASWQCESWTVLQMTKGLLSRLYGVLFDTVVESTPSTATVATSRVKRPTATDHIVSWDVFGHFRTEPI